MLPNPEATDFPTLAEAYKAGDERSVYVQLNKLAGKVIGSTPVTLRGMDRDEVKSELVVDGYEALRTYVEHGATGVVSLRMKDRLSNKLNDRRRRNREVQSGLPEDYTPEEGESTYDPSVRILEILDAKHKLEVLRGLPLSPDERMALESLLEWNGEKPEAAIDLGWTDGKMRKVIKGIRDKALKHEEFKEYLP